MKVEFEGQIIEFPDDASPIEIEESMNSLFPASKAASTIGQREEYRWDKGMALIDNASVWKLAREGKITKEQALGRIADRNARFTPENDERFAADNVPERMLGASTQLSPYMLESAANGLLYGETFGAAAAAAAFVAGKAPPLALFPEEIATVPAANMAGRAVGQSFGIIQKAADVEGNLLYGELVSSGIDHNLAVAASLPAGYAIGAIEYWQLGALVNRFLPPGTVYSRRLIADAMKKAFAGKTGAARKIAEAGTAMASRLVLTTTAEIGQEVLQEIISLGAEVSAHIIKAGNEQAGYEGPDIEDIKAQLADTFVQSLLGFPLLGLPGSVVAGVKTARARSAATAEMQGMLGEVDEETVVQLQQEFGVGAAPAPITQLGAESLKTDLAPIVEEAAKHKSFTDFLNSVEVGLTEDDAVNLGFDNHLSMMSSIYERAQATKALRSLRPDAGEDVVELDQDAEVASELIPETGEPDVSFDFGKNLVREVIGRESPAVSKIKARLDAIQDAKQRAALARDALSELNQMHRWLRNRIRPFVKVEKEEFRRVPRVYRNKNGQALDDASSEFGGIFNAKFESTDEFIDFLAALGQRRSELREIIKSARSQFVRTREETLLSQRLRDLGKGMKEGRRLQKAESKQLHTDLIRLIESSDMEAKDKAGFLRTIKNIQTSEQMEKNLPEITQRIERLAEASEKKEIKRRIRALVERSKPSRAAGKPRGRFTPEIQELMNSLRPIVKLSKTKANAALSESIESVGDTIPSGDEAMKRRVLLIQADVASVHDAQETLSDLAAAVASGKVVHEIMVQGRRMRTDRVVQEVVRIVTGGKGLTPGVATFGLKSAEQRAKEAGFLAKASLALDQGLDFTVIAWNGLLDTLSLKDKSSQPGKSLLSQFGDVFQETVNERIGVHKANVRIREFTQKAYGIEQDQVIQKLRDNHKQQDLGTFTNTEGIKDKLVMSKDQAIKRWMEWQDPTLKETFTSENGMAWTPEMLAAVGLEGAPEKTGLLTEQDKAFGRAMLSFYQEYYQPINDVYKRLHFINLPHNPFYSPIRRAVDQPKSEGFGDLLQELQSRASLEGGSFISRVKNIRPLEQTSATAVIQEHIVAMERFKAWGEKIRDLNAVFKDPAVRQAITENYGKKRYDRVMRYLENYTRGGSDRSNRIRWLDRLRIKFTKSVLGVRPVILVKQLMSFPAFAETIPVAEFVSGLVDFATDPAGKTKILKESEWASLRGENIDRDIKTAIQEDRFKAFANSPTFTNRLMLNVRIGDMGAIVMGGWTVYRYARKQGKTHEQALDIFSRIANRTQQSGDIAEQSLFQQGGSIAQTMTMFASAPNQYLRIEIMAIRNYRAGRMSLGRLAKVLAIYHLILPMLFQLAADAFRWKPDEQLRSAIFGPLNGLFIIGDALDYVLRWGLRLAGFDELHQFPTDITPLESLGDDFATILRRIGDHVGGEFITDEEWWTALRALSGIGGALSGVPAKAGVDLVGAVNKVIEGDLRDGLPGLLGWTEFSLQD